MKGYFIQSKFTSGEWSKRLEGQVGLQQYANALYTLENFYIDPHGPVALRPGWKFINETKDSTKQSFLVPFEFSANTAYVLEFGHQYIRFYKNGAQIKTTYSAWAGPGTWYSPGELVISGGLDYRCIVAHSSAALFATDLASGYWVACSPTSGEVDLTYEIPSPYASTDLASVMVKWCASADVMYLWHKSYAPQKLSRTGDASWSLNAVKFNPAPIKEEGFSPAHSLTLGAATGLAVTFTAGGASFITGNVGQVISAGAGRASIVSFTSNTVVTCDILDNFEDTSFASGEWTIEGTPYGELTPSSDTPKGAIISLTSTGGSETVHNLLHASTDSWIASGAGTDLYYLTITSPVYTATKPGRVYIDGVQCVKGILGPLGILQWSWADNDMLGYNTIYLRMDSGNPIGVDPDSYITEGDDYIKWSTVTTTFSDIFRPTDVGKYVRINGGLVKITAYTNAAIVYGEIVKELDSVDESTSWTLESEVWDSTNGYPSCGTFYEDRLIAAGCPAYPETVWGSMVGDYENFSPGTDDADAIEFTVAGREISKIKWVEPDEYLMVGSSSKVTRVGPDSSGDVLTPLNAIAKKQSSDGAADIMPIPVKNAVLYVERTGLDDTKGLKLGEIAWKWETENYTTNDMTIMADHMSSGGFLGICYQKEPFNILWAWDYDGNVSALTYLREEEVVGWHRHPTDGVVESMTTIPGDGYHEVWAVIKRTIGGVVKRYVERMAKFFNDDAATYTANKGLNAFFVDSGITYNSTSTTTITGLDHLEGESVVALADGSYVTTRTVTSGAITLPVAATVVHVGLPYTGTLQTMRLDLNINDGTVQGRVKSIEELIIRVFQSATFKAGRDASNLDVCYDKERTITLGAPYTLFTGDIPMQFDDRFNRDGRVMIVQDKPMPLTVVAIVTQANM